MHHWGIIMTQYTVEEMMKAFAKDAVEFGQEYDKNLDYSEDSVKEIDNILEMVHRSLPIDFKTKIVNPGPSEQKLATISKIYGAYIGEVIQKHYGGKWSIEMNTIIFTMGETKLFLPAKVYQRIKNGSEENVWYYYQLLKQDFEESGV